MASHNSENGSDDAILLVRRYIDNKASTIIRSALEEVTGCSILAGSAFPNQCNHYEEDEIRNRSVNGRPDDLADNNSDLETVHKTDAISPSHYDDDSMESQNNREEQVPFPESPEFAERDDQSNISDEDSRTSSQSAYDADGSSTNSQEQMPPHMTMNPIFNRQYPFDGIGTVPYTVAGVGDVHPYQPCHSYRPGFDINHMQMLEDLGESSRFHHMPMCPHNPDFQRNMAFHESFLNNRMLYTTDPCPPIGERFFHSDQSLQNVLPPICNYVPPNCDYINRMQMQQNYNAVNHMPMHENFDNSNHIPMLPLNHPDYNGFMYQFNSSAVDDAGDAVTRTACQDRGDGWVHHSHLQQSNIPRTDMEDINAFQMQTPVQESSISNRVNAQYVQEVIDMGISGYSSPNQESCCTNGNSSAIFRCQIPACEFADCNSTFLESNPSNVVRQLDSQIAVDETLHPIQPLVEETDMENTENHIPMDELKLAKGPNIQDVIKIDSSRESTPNRESYSSPNAGFPLGYQWEIRSRDSSAVNSTFLESNPSNVVRQLDSQIAVDETLHPTQPLVEEAEMETHPAGFPSVYQRQIPSRYSSAVNSTFLESNLSNVVRQLDSQIAVDETLHLIQPLVEETDMENTKNHIPMDELTLAKGPNIQDVIEIDSSRESTPDRDSYSSPNAGFPLGYQQEIRSRDSSAVNSTFLESNPSNVVRQLDSQIAVDEILHPSQPLVEEAEMETHPAGFPSVYQRQIPSRYSLAVNSTFDEPNASNGNGQFFYPIAEERVVQHISVEVPNYASSVFDATMNKGIDVDLSKDRESCFAPNDGIMQDFQGQICSQESSANNGTFDRSDQTITCPVEINSNLRSLQQSPVPGTSLDLELDMRPAGGNRRSKSQNQNPPPLADMRQGRGNRRSETQTRRQRTTETSSSSSDISVGQPCTVVTKPWTFRTDDAIEPSETGSWWSENQGGSMFGAKRSPSIPPVPSPFSTRWIGKECLIQATVEASRANNTPTKTLYSYNKKKKDSKSESFKKNQPAKNNPTISVTKPKGQTSATTPPQNIWDNAIRDAGASKSYCKSRIRKKAESKLPTPTSLLSAKTKTTDEGSRLTASDKNPSADDFSSSPGVYKYDAQAEIDCTQDRSTGVRKLGDTSKPKVYDTDFIKPHDSAKSYNAERSSKEKAYNYFLPKNLSNDNYLNSPRDDCELSPTKVPTPPPPPPPAGPAQVQIYDYLQQDQVPKERCMDLSTLCLPVPKSEELRKTSYVSKKYTNKYFGLTTPAERKRADDKIFDFLSKDDIQRKKNVTFKKPTITEADFEWGPSETANDDFGESCESTTQPDAEGVSLEYQYEHEDDDEEHDDPYRKYTRPYNLKRPHTSSENNDNNNTKYSALSAQPDSPAPKSKDTLENLDNPLADFDSFKSKSTGQRSIETSCRDFSYGESSLIGSRFQPESVKPFDMDSSSISPTYPLYVPDHHDSPEKNPTPDNPMPNTSMTKDFMTDTPVKSPEPNLKTLKRSANQEKCAPRKRAKSTNTTIVTRSRTDPATKFSWANDQKKPTTAAAETKPLPLIMPGSCYPREGGENAPSTSAAWNSNLDFSLNAEKPNLEVPKWRIVEVTDGSYCSEPEENVEDCMYTKRHTKMELEEKRIKRWDIQRLKEQNLLKKLKDRQEKINSGGNKVTWSYKTEKKNPRQKTWPSYDEVMYIEITDTLPSEEFPEVVPELETPKREPALPRLRSGAKKRKRRTVSKRKGKATAQKVAKTEVVQKAAAATATEKNEESNKKD